MSITEIDSVDTRNKFVSENHIAVIDYYATWCKPCKRIEPDYKSLAEEYEGKVVFAKEDYSKQLDLEELSEAVKCLPTFHIYVGGEIKCVIEGADLPKVKQNLELILLS